MHKFWALSYHAFFGSNHAQNGKLKSLLCETKRTFSTSFLRSAFRRRNIMQWRVSQKTRPKSSVLSLTLK